MDEYKPLKKFVDHIHEMHKSLGHHKKFCRMHAQSVESSNVEPILIGYKVLMITYTNEILLECVAQTSST